MKRGRGGAGQIDKGKHDDKEGGVRIRALISFCVEQNATGFMLLSPAARLADWHVADDADDKQGFRSPRPPRGASSAQVNRKLKK